jgi:hypothetical protein
MLPFVAVLVFVCQLLDCWERNRMMRQRGNRDVDLPAPGPVSGFSALMPASFVPPMGNRKFFKPALEQPSLYVSTTLNPKNRALVRRLERLRDDKRPQYNFQERAQWGNHVYEALEVVLETVRTHAATVTLQNYSRLRSVPSWLACLCCVWCWFSRVINSCTPVVFSQRRK